MLTGIKSVARRVLLQGQEMPFRKPGFAAYRAVVDVNKMRSDPELSWILEKPALNIWYVSSTGTAYHDGEPNQETRIGDSRHVMTYTIGAGKTFNMVLSHPDTSDPATWNARTSLEDMKAEFQGWDPV